MWLGWGASSEDRFLSKAELRLKKKKAYDKAFWDRRIKEGQEFNQQMYKERDEYCAQEPSPLITPNEIDNLYLNTYMDDIGGYRFIGQLPKWHTAYWRKHPNGYFKLMTPIKLIYSLGLERRYNQWIDLQCVIYAFLKDRIPEIMANYSRDHWNLKSHKKNTTPLLYRAINWTRWRKIMDEWDAKYWKRGRSMMFQAVKDIYTYWYWSPLQWLHWIGPSYLIADVMYDWFGHCDYISNFWNAKDYIAHRTMLHNMTLAIQDPKIKREDLNQVPYFIMDRPLLMRVPSNKIQTEDELKSNNWEYDYYWVSLAGIKEFPSWEEIVKKYGIGEKKRWSLSSFKQPYPIQPACKAPHNLYLEER